MITSLLCLKSFRGFPIAIWTNSKFLNAEYAVLLGLVQEHISSPISCLVPCLFCLVPNSFAIQCEFKVTKTFSVSPLNLNSLSIKQTQGHSSRCPWNIKYLSEQSFPNFLAPPTQPHHSISESVRFFLCDLISHSTLPTFLSMPFLIPDMSALKTGSASYFCVLRP